MSAMREILFRGKRLDNGKWVYGYLFVNEVNGDTMILNGWESPVETDVDHLTVGEYTGLTDKNGVKIFEGDIVHCRGGEYYQGYYEGNEKVVVEDIADGICVFLGEVELLEIIGNIHDNPELLEGGGEE